MDAVKRHMRSVCGDVLDEMKGDNYEVSINVILCTNAGTPSCIDCNEL